MTCHEGTFYKGAIGGVRLKIRTLFIAFLNEEAHSLPLWMKYGKEKAKGR